MSPSQARLLFRIPQRRSIRHAPDSRGSMVGVIFLTQTRFSRSNRLRAHFKTMMISVFLWFLGGWVGGFFFFFFFRFGTSLAHSAVWSPSTRPPCLMVLMRPVGPLAPVASAQFPRSPSDSKPVRSSPWVPCPRQISVFWVLSYLPPSAKRFVFCHFHSTQTHHRL